MKNLIYIFLFSTIFYVNGQEVQPTVTENYVYKTIYKERYQESQLPSASDIDKIQSIMYYDGLGREKQTILVRQGGSYNNTQADLIIPSVYDNYGRQSKTYLSLPISFNNGDYYGGVIEDLGNYYLNKYPEDLGTDFNNPYSSKTFDKSPLNRIKTQGAPGKSWFNAGDNINIEGGDTHPIRFAYEANDTNEVYLYNVTFPSGNTEEPSLSFNGYYPTNVLYKNITRDENWVTQGPVDDEINPNLDHSVEEFKDKQGRVVLKRTYNNDAPHDTQYVYDDFGNLTYVLSPLASVQLRSAKSSNNSNSIIDDLCYQYHYDSRNRLIEKKIPGKGREYIVYDKLDRPVLTQDALLGKKGEWLFTKYDALNRVVYTGLVNIGQTRLQVQANVDSQTIFNETSGSAMINGVNTHYTNTVYPQNIAELHAINFYDTYNSTLTNVASDPQTVLGQLTSNETVSLPMGSKVRVFATGKSVHWITSINYYDDKARPIYAASYNSYLNTTDIVESQLDFTGKVLRTKSYHTKSAQTIEVTDNFTYDHANRLLSQRQQINGDDSQQIVANHYDELGQLIKKDVGGQLDAISFKDVIGVTINETTGIITKTEPTGWGNAGLATIKQISGDGYIEFSPNQTNKNIMVGLSTTNQDANYNTIKYAINMQWQGLVRIYENGGFKGTHAQYNAGDVFRVERVGSTIYYKLNGEIFYTSTISSTGDLLGDMSFHNQGSISNVALVDNSNAYGLQEVDYAYNIRGWLKNINNISDLGDDLFGFNLRYYDSSNETHGPSLFNGNISQANWKSANDHTTYTYYYSYDDLNRIKKAKFYGGSYTSRYNLSAVTYDKNGNIARLIREGHIVDQPDKDTPSDFGTSDNLYYSYDGNQLTKVKDYADTNHGFIDGNLSGDDYDYDTNGNMVSDANKGITQITYNYLNLPTKVVTAQGEIDYIYDALGMKLQKRVTENGALTTTDYAGNYIYENGTLKFFNQPEGYVEPEGYGDGFNYVYQYKDHLGNIRLSYNEKAPYINSDFSTDHNGWIYIGGATDGGIELDNGRLKVNVKNAYNGVRYHINEIFSIGDEVHVNLDLDKANTNKVRILLSERDANDNLISWYVLNSNAETNHYTFTHMIQAGVKLRLYIDKSNTNNGVSTQFYLDNVIVSTNDLDIVEENNYYPFGLKHKGYNNVVNSTNIAQNWKYNGTELNESLSLNLYEMDMRQYDPAIARWTSIDPVTHHSMSTYNAFDNNPIYWADPSGSDAINLKGNTLTINWNEVEEGEEGSTWNSNEPKEGQTREAEVPDGSGRHGDGKSIQTQYYHAGGVNGSEPDWYSGYQYLKRIAPVALNLARYIDGGSISGMEITGSYDQFISFISSRNTSGELFEFLLSYGRSLNVTIPKADGRINEDNLSTIGLFLPGLRILGSSVTTSEGFLFGSFTARTPWNIPVQRFGNMSLSRPDYWGLRLGSNKFVNRTFVAIKPEWNPLTQYTTGIIPKGTSIRFGIIGPQGLNYPGGSFQFMLNSNKVIYQASKMTN